MLIIITNISFKEDKIKILSVFRTHSHIRVNKDFEKLGINSGDKIVSCNNKSVSCKNDLISACNENTQSIVIKLPCGSIKNINLNASRESIAKNVELKESNTPQSILKRIIGGIKITNNILKASLYGIISIFKKRDFKKVSGTLGMLRMSINAAGKGLGMLMAFMAIISIGLAFTNLIPIPVFDGGQIVILLISKLLGKPLPEKVHEGITYISFGIMLLLLAFTTYQDVINWIF